MFSLNKWNQREICSEILMIDFHVTWKIMDYPSKLMKIYSTTLGLFMARHLNLEHHHWPPSAYIS
jgi:D-lyxose ketol-isomerase